MKNIQNILIFFTALSLSMLAAHVQTCAQDAQTVTKPSLVVFVVGMESNQVGDFLAILVGNALSDGDRYEVITRTDAVQKKLRELREYEQSGNVNEGELIEWGRQNNVSMLCLITSIKLDEYMFAAQLTDVKSNKLVGNGDCSSAALGSADMKKAAELLAEQLQGKGDKVSSDKVSSGKVSNDKVSNDKVSSGVTSRDSDGKKNGDTYNPDGIELVYVEGTDGTFGIQGFYIGKYEITQAQYQKVTGVNPSKSKAPNKPVANVSRNDAQEFLSKLNSLTGRDYRLPSEEEWVYAANGGLKNDVYEYAGSNNIHEVAWFTDNSGGQTHPVGTKSPNSIGIYDMSGNVWELCQDYYDSSGSRRVFRGGSSGFNASSCRVASRNRDSPGSRGAFLGFRVVLP